MHYQRRGQLQLLMGRVVQFSHLKFIRLFGPDKGVERKAGEFSNWSQGMMQRIQLQNVEREISKDCVCCISQY